MCISCNFYLKKKNGLKFMDNMSMPQHSGINVISSLMNDLRVSDGDPLADNEIETYLKFLHINDDVQLEKLRKLRFKMEQDELLRIKSFNKFVDRKRMIQTDLKKTENSEGQRDPEKAVHQGGPKEKGISPKHGKFYSRPMTEGRMIDNGGLQREIEKIRKVREESPEKFKSLITQMKKVKHKFKMTFPLKLTI